MRRAGTFRIRQIAGVFRGAQKQFGRRRTRLERSNLAVNLPDNLKMCAVVRFLAGWMDVGGAIEPIRGQIFERLF